MSSAQLQSGSKLSPVRDFRRRLLTCRPSGGHTTSMSRRAGLTLTEVMIAIAITLVLLGVLIRMFSYASGEITQGRAVIELSGQLRTISDRLQTDLEGVTVPLLPWTETADGLGYFEYLEGDAFVDNPVAGDTTIGDNDDVLMLTARSKGRPFRGRYWQRSGSPTIIESDLAEIIWWTTLDDRNGNGVQDSGEQLILRRRVLLIRPDLNQLANGALMGVLDPTEGPNNLAAFYSRNDISVRPGVNGLVANSLSDLTLRENRFAHFIGYAPGNYPPTGNLATLTNTINASFPNPISRDWLNALVLAGNYEGEDVVLSSVVSFDVKIFDPLARIYDNRTATGVAPGRIPLSPADPGYAIEVSQDLSTYGVTNVLDSHVGLGAYVDLGYDRLYSALALPGATFGSHFSGPPNQLSYQPNMIPQIAYSTWPTSYESDSIRQPSGSPVPTNIDNPSTNGLDDDQNGIVDDPAERETSPPYPFQVRGLQVRIRVLEFDTKQVRQATIVTDFIPE